MANPYLANGVGSPQSIYQTSTVKSHPIGTKGDMGDGRIFYYTSLSNAATGIDRARLLMRRSEANPTGIFNQVQTTSGAANLVAGATRVTVDVNAANAVAIVAGELIEGFLSMNDNTGEGFEYKIRNHTTITAVAGTLTLDLYDPIVVAGSATSDISLLHQPYRNPLISSTLGQACGVSKVDVGGGSGSSATAETYYWAQTWGECTVLSGVAILLGQSAIQSVATAGAVTVGAAVTDVVIGGGTLLTVSTEHQVVMLKIRP